MVAWALSNLFIPYSPFIQDEAFQLECLPDTAFSVAFCQVQMWSVPFKTLDTPVNEKERRTFY
jgi:hypothetical protein